MLEEKSQFALMDNWKNPVNRTMFRVQSWKALAVFITVSSVGLVCCYRTSSSELRRRLAAADCEVGKVCELNADNFDDTIKGQTTMVKFYKPGCPHCVTMKPRFEKAASSLWWEDIQLMEMDGEKNKSIAKQFGITAYPTTLFFRDGHVVTEFNDEEKIYDADGPSTNKILEIMREEHPNKWSWASKPGALWISLYVVLPAIGLGIVYWGYNWWYGRKETPESPDDKPQAEPQDKPFNDHRAHRTEDASIARAPDVPQLEASKPYQKEESDLPFWMFLLSALLVLLFVVVCCCCEQPAPEAARGQMAPLRDIENPAPRRPGGSLPRPLAFDKQYRQVKAEQRKKSQTAGMKEKIREDIREIRRLSRDLSEQIEDTRRAYQQRKKIKCASEHTAEQASQADVFAV